MSIRSNPLVLSFLHFSNWYKAGPKPNYFLFSTPRSGSTWVKELIGSQSGFRNCEEPFNLRDNNISGYLGNAEWKDIYQEPINPIALDYLDSLVECRRATAFNNPIPFRNNYRLRTNRTIFKFLHSMEDRMNQLGERYDAKIILLVRHPLAVSTSRKSCPRLTSFIDSDYSRNFTAEQIAFSKSIIDSGTAMEKLVLSWCLQNAVMLKQRKEGWLTLTYEQLVMEPDKMLNVICDDLEFKEPEKMKAAWGQPSASTYQSDTGTQKLLAADSTKEKTQYLIEKWRKIVKDDEERHLMSMLERFDIDIYKHGDLLPNKEYWFD